MSEPYIVAPKSLQAFPPLEEAPREAKLYVPWGSSRELLLYKGDEAIIHGPAGTGKSRGSLEKLYLLGLKYPGMRGLIVRKTRESITQSAMVTWEQKVVPDNGTVKWRTTEQQYEFYNGSVIVVGGMDKASRIMSTDYDIIYVQEATELTENDWESLTTRARYGLVPYNQVIGDCNPGPGTHWILSRAKKKGLKLYQSVHEDNPELFDHKTRQWTEKGIAYIRKLDALTGVRYLRLRKGLWVSAEGQIYTEYSPDIHLIPSFDIPDSWRKFMVVDFGYTNPFVCQWWALDDDNRMYLYREIYHTKRTVREHAEKIKELTGEENIEAVVCDWDAEDRATLEENGIGPTSPADKAVRVGIDSVKERLKLDGLNKPRLYMFRDCTVEYDQDLIEAYKPSRTQDEWEAYIWAQGDKDAPVKADDHGMDGVRYAVRYADTSDYLRGGVLV
jgi:phage terminase large subunit